ncbi:MAG: hypothetical protein WKG07_39090 [Hymenobacter sp.]
MEVMDLNEQLMELEMEPDAAATATAQRRGNCPGRHPRRGHSARTGRLRRRYPPTTARPPWRQVRTYYLKKRYLLRHSASNWLPLRPARDYRPSGMFYKFILPGWRNR